MPPPARRRSILVTLLAWAIIVGSGLVLPISFISLLMTFSHHYGSSGTVVGFLTIIVAPPVSFVAGIALLRRQRWAWFYGVALSTLVFVWNLVIVARGPQPQQVIVSPTGTTTTIMATDTAYDLPFVIVAGAVLAVLLLPWVRADFFRATGSPHASHTQPPSSPAPPDPTTAGAPRDWRVGHRGRDCMFYEERHGGHWERIEIDGEMLTDRAHHVIYFASPTDWRRYPEWARHRRDEIITRIKSEFRSPDYEYSEGGTILPLTGTASAPASVLPPTPPAGRSTLSQRQAVAIAIIFLLGITAFSGWRAWQGVQTGRIPTLTKRSVTRSEVLLAHEPAQFWLWVGIYAAAGTGSLGLAGWVCWLSRPSARPHR